METLSSEVTEVVQELKSKGNTAYGSGDYVEAIKYFTEALQLDNTNGTLYCNRSMAYSSLLQWEDALSDAKMVIHDLSLPYSSEIGCEIITKI
jgi:tetratricopeptide (TPR) repeat protein